MQAQAQALQEDPEAHPTLRELTDLASTDLAEAEVVLEEHETMLRSPLASHRTQKKESELATHPPHGCQHVPVGFHWP